jgi:hypothetical protein
MKRWCFSLLSLLATVSLAWGQEWSVKPDATWDRVFRRSQGWIGADGAYSVPLRGPWSGWLFSDTFVGSVARDGSIVPSFAFLHNSWARLSNLQPGMQLFSTRPLVHGASAKRWYWVYQPVLEPSTQEGWLFLGEFGSTEEGPEGLNFAQTGSAMASLDWRGEQPVLGKPRKVPFFRTQPAPTHFGAAAIADDKWLYIYGTRDYQVRKELVLARAPRVNPAEFFRWEFWSAIGWNSRSEAVQPLVDETSNELSVYRRGAEYRLLHQVGTEIRLHRSQAPEGPWSAPVVVFRTEVEPPGTSYNAKAHPHIVDRQGGMLITYNTNAFPPDEVLKRADRYRPRCVRLYGDPWGP